MKKFKTEHLSLTIRKTTKAERKHFLIVAGLTVCLIVGWLLWH